MVAVLAAALFSTVASLATALFALLCQLNSFRSEVAGRFDGVNARFDALTADVAEVRVGLSRLEQKLDDHIASPRPAH